MMRTNLATFAAFATIQLTIGTPIKDTTHPNFEEITPNNSLPQGYWTSQGFVQDDMAVGHLSQGEAFA